MYEQGVRLRLVRLRIYRRAYEIERELHEAPDGPALKVTAAWDGLELVLPQRVHSRAEYSRDT